MGNSNLTVRVYYEDTDTLGMVYHANYLKYLERGRSEFVRERGYDQKDIITELGVFFSVREMNIDYIKPAVFEQKLKVHTMISAAKGARLFFKQKISCIDTGELHCTAEVLIACIDNTTKKPTRLPKSFITEIVDV